MTTPSDLDRQLRKELTDSVADVRADAMLVHQLIATAQSGGSAHRQRRNWIAPLMAAAAVIAIVVVTVAVTSSKSHDSKTPPSTQSSDLVPPPPVSDTAPTPSSPNVLGPDGLGKLKLGMNRAQALAERCVTKIDPASDCALIHLVGSPVTPNSGDGYLSKKYGIVAIFLPVGTKVKTSEGIGVGSSIAAVSQAYPGTVYNISTRQDAGPRAAVPGHPDAGTTSFPMAAPGFVQRIAPRPAESGLLRLTVSTRGSDDAVGAANPSRTGRVVASSAFSVPREIGRTLSDPGSSVRLMDGVIGELFASATERMLAQHVTDAPGSMLRAPAITTRGRVYAFATKASVIVKLPAHRVRELIDAGVGAPCVTGKAPLLKNGSGLGAWR